MSIRERLAAQGYPNVPIARTFEQHLDMSEYPYAVEYPSGECMLFVADGSGVSLDVMEGNANSVT